MSRVAVVTGGEGGMGLATVKQLVGRNIKVASFDLRSDPPVDVSDPTAVGRAIERVRETLGPIDIVVNAAGTSSGGSLEEDGFEDLWQRTFDVNVTGAMHVVKAALEDLLASGSGRVVNVASTEAMTAGRRTMAYSSSKHALVGFTRSLAVSYGRRGLTANCVCPGATDTPMVAAITPEDRAAYGRRNIPVGRYGRPEEIAFVIAMLTEPEAAFVNGSVIVVDGGMLAAAR